MTGTPLTHEQFAWLMSLPPDHPERLAWSGRPEFESMRALYEQFESPPAPAADDRAAREAEAEMERRFRDALPSEPVAPARPARPAARETARPWWSVIPRPAYAMAAVVIVAAAGALYLTRPRVQEFRGAEGAPVILEPRRIEGGLEIRWTPVAGAASYRLSFVDDSMLEIAAVEARSGTSYRLESSALPPGLEHGARVMVQVRPVRDGEAGPAGTTSLVVP